RHFSWRFSMGLSLRQRFSLAAFTGMVFVISLMAIKPAPLSQEQRIRESMNLGRASLKIGMTKNQVLELLTADGCTIVPVGTKETGDRSDQTEQRKNKVEALTLLRDSQNEASRIAANLFFRDGKLIMAARPIQFSSSDSEEAVEAFYSLISKFEGDGH